MAKILLKNEEALQVCRSSRPAPGAIKKVLEWAETSPSPDKVLPLLLLQTENHVSRKGLDQPFHQALARCAQNNDQALWDTVNQDSDAYRILHALRALTAPGSNVGWNRLFDLGRQRILRIHWKTIEDQAKKAGVEIPQDVLMAQASFEAERGTSDFYSLLKARKPLLPKDS